VAVMRLEYQILLKSPPPLTLLAGSAHGCIVVATLFGVYVVIVTKYYNRKQVDNERKFV